MYDCRRLCAHVVVIILMRRVIVSSQYDDLVLVVIVHHLFLFELFERAKYIRLQTINQIYGRQYDVEHELKVL